MKKLKIFLITIISVIIFPSLVNAASASISVTSSSQVVLNQKVTVTVKLSSSTAIGSWEMQLNYDKNYLQLTSSTAEGAGNYMVNAASTAEGIKSKTYTLTFKALKTGSTSLSIGSYLVYDNDMKEMTVSDSSKTIKIITQKELEDSYSKDNYLKSLSIDGFELNPVFDKNTTNYSVNVPEGTTTVTVNALANDSKSTINGDGTIEVTEGINTINVVVKAQNGSERTYVILVNVIDENPINVTVNNINYTVIKLRSNYLCPELYSEKTVTIDGIEVPACYNEKVNYTLVGLKKEDGTIENYIYNNGKYNKYVETIGTSLKIIILDYNDDIDGLTKYKEKIDGEEHTVFKTNKNAKNYVVYGMNLEDGEKRFYNYDSVNKTFTLYDTERIDELEKIVKTYMYVIIVFGAGLFLSIICMINMSMKRKKKIKIKENTEDINSLDDFENKVSKKERKKKKEKQKEEIEESVIQEDVNEIQEIINKDEEEFFDILEEDKKHKKKNKKEKNKNEES